MLTDQQKRLFYWVGTVLSSLLAIGIWLLVFGALEGCTSLYDRAKAKYATQTTDTLYSTVTATVPADTITRVFRTDTTHYIERVKQGRATLTIVREPTNTTVIAECDSASVSQKIATQIQNQVWGVDAKYQRYFWIAIAVAAGLFIIMGFVILLAFIAYKLSRTYTISQKHEPAPSPN